MEKHQFRAIDGLKGIFIFVIVIMHIQATFGYSFRAVLGPIYEYGGYFGNYCFFILSGFLMGYRYTSRIMTDGENGIGFGMYLKRRLRKIFPLYILTNIVALIIDLLSYGTSVIDLKKIILTFFMMTTGWIENGDVPYNGAAWFVNVLLLCWLLFYLICRLGRKNKTVFIVLAAVLCLLGCTFIVCDINVPFCFQTSGEGYLNFFLGVLLAMWFQYREEKGNMRQTPGWIALALVVVAAGLCIGLGGLRNVTSNIPIAVAILCLLLIIAVLFTKPLTVIIGNSVFSFFGQISLSIFLWHLPLLSLMSLIGGATGFHQLDFKVQMFIYLALTILVSFLSHRFLEPVINRGDKKQVSES